MNALGNRAGRRRSVARVWRLVAAAAVSSWLSVAHAELRLTGVGGAVRENVLAHLDLDEESCDAPEWRIRQLFDIAPRQIRAALEAHGFYHAEISADLDLDAEACWSAEITIRAGDPVRIRTLDLRLEGEAAEDPSFVTAFNGSELQTGAALHHGRYEQLKGRLLTLAAERGYVTAAFPASRIDVYPDELAADIRLVFDSGPRYAFGEIELRQEVLQEPLLRAYLGFDTGHPYDQRQLTSFHVALTDSGYFYMVDVRPLAPDHELRQIPLAVTLTPAPRRLITYGLGFSTDTGPRLRFGRDNRRWNDRGHQFGMDAQLSPVVSEVTVQYRFPFGDPRTEWVSFDGGTRFERTDSAESDSVQFGARRVVDLAGAWTRTQRVNLLFEDFEVGDQRGSSRLLMPGMEWSRTRADNAIRPRQGSRLDFELRAASDALGSDTTFAQGVVYGKWIRSLPSGARLLLRGQLGATWEDSLEALPPSVRFFAGGDTSVRGYRFASLGPQNEQGETIGGPSLLTGSFEYERPLAERWPRWSFAAFVDSGNAFRGTDFRPKTGVGVGARWHSPLGPIRFDIAYPLNEAGHGPRLHLTLGPDL